MWTVIVSMVLSFLACLSFMIGLGKRLPNLVKGLQLGFLLVALVPTVMFVVELVMHQFDRPGYFITHLVSVSMLLIARVGLGMDAVNATKQ